MIGSQPGILECSLYLILCVPDSIPDENRFDMMMLAMTLLINLVQQCADNKQLLLESKAPPVDHIFNGKFQLDNQDLSFLLAFYRIFITNFCF